MKRRTLFSLLPAASVAVLAAASGPVAQAAPIPLPVRHRLADYVLWAPPDIGDCPCCGGHHEVYTHGCQPVAFARGRAIVPDAEARPATPEAIPEAYVQDCPLSRSELRAPHQHTEYRWEGA